MESQGRLTSAACENGRMGIELGDTGIPGRGRESKGTYCWLV